MFGALAKAHCRQVTASPRTESLIVMVFCPWLAADAVWKLYSAIRSLFTGEVFRTLTVTLPLLSACREC